MTFATIMKAAKLEDLADKGEVPEATFRRLAKICHPDRNPLDIAGAQAAMAHINRLRDGDKPTEIKIGAWTIGPVIARGDIADIYRTTDGQAFKIARSKADNDLMDRERRSLEILHDKDADAKLSRYIPVLRESFSASARRVNVLEEAAGYIPLDEIVERTHGILDFRHGIWMMNRLLTALGYVHRRGIVHGAIVPSHILYEPATHNMKLVDWCYSCSPNEHVPAMVKKYKELYPREVLLKKPVTPATDIYMASRSIHWAVSTTPTVFKGLFEWCTAESMAARPPDAWTFQDRWLDMAKRVYGDPKFVELRIPAN